MLAGGKVEKGSSDGVQLLADIKKVFDVSDKDRYFQPSVILLKRLLELPGSPWRDRGGRDRPLTVRGLARMLRAYDIYPRMTRWTRNCRGYRRSDFEVAWECYPGPEGATSATSQAGRGLSLVSEAQPNSGVADGEDGANPRQNRSVADVTDPAVPSAATVPSAAAPTVEVQVPSATVLLADLTSAPATAVPVPQTVQSNRPPAQRLMKR